MGTENNTNRGFAPEKTHNVAPSGTRRTVRRLTPEEIEERRAKAAEQRRQRRETFFARLIFGAMVYLLCTLIIFGFVASLYFWTESPEILTLEILDGRGEVLETVEGDEFIINNVPYVSATALSGIYDFTLAGDKNRVSLHFHDAEESLSLTKDSSSVEINGCKVRLSAPIIFTDDYYIPLELIRNYFNGVTIVYDSEEETARLSVDEDVEVFLKLHLPVGTETPQA